MEELGVRLTAEISNYINNINTAGESTVQLADQTDQALANIRAGISSVNQLNTTGLNTALSTAGVSVATLDNSVTVLSTNISRNIASVNQSNVSAFVASLNQVSTTSAATDAAVTQLSTDISRNISAINNSNISAFISSINEGRVSIVGLQNELDRTTSSPIVSNLNNTSASAEQVIRSVRSLEIEMASYRRIAEAATNPAIVDTYNSKIQLLEGQISRLKLSGRVGFEGLATSASTASGQIQSVSLRAVTARTSMATLRSATHGLSGGVDGLASAFPVLLHHFQTLTGETGGVKNAFGTLTKTLMGPAGILIAISALAPFIVDISKKISGLGMSAEETAAELKKSKAANKEYIESLDDVDKSRLKGGQNAQSELISLKVLYGITQDVAVSTKQRGQAVDELQKKYPEYFKNITDEAILAGKAADKYAELSNSILATARARAGEDLIAKNSGRQLENIQKITDARIAYAKADAKITALDTKRNNLPGGGNTYEFSGITGKIASDRAKALKQLLEAGDTIRNSKVDNNKLDERNLQLTKEITAQVLKGADLAGKVGDAPKDSKSKKIKTQSDVVKDLNIALTQSDLLVGSTFDQRNSSKVDAYQKAINDLIKIGIDPAAAAIDELKKSILDIQQITADRKAQNLFNFELPTRIGGEISKQLEATKVEVVKGLSAISADAEPIFQDILNPDRLVNKNKKINLRDAMRFGSLAEEATRIKSEIKDLDDAFLRGGVGYDKYLERYNNLTNGLRKNTALAELTKNTQELLNGTFKDTLSGVSSAIGSALTNGGNVFESAGNALLGSFSDFLGNFGKLLVDYGLAAVGFAKLQAAILIPGAGIFAGAAAIAAGIALQVAAGAITGLVSGKGSRSGGKGVTAFANGGIISGPTLGLMGEYAGAKNNPEVVAPLSKLKSMISDVSGTSQVEVYGRLRGNDIFLSNRNTGELRKR